VILLLLPLDLLQVAHLPVDVFVVGLLAVAVDQHFSRGDPAQVVYFVLLLDHVVVLRNVVGLLVLTVLHVLHVPFQRLPFI